MSSVPLADPLDEARVIVAGAFLTIRAEDAISILPLARDGEPWSHAAICLLAKQLTERGEALPLPLQEYVVFRASVPLRRNQGRGRYDNFIRDVVIKAAVRRMVDRGLAATRNPALRGDDSATPFSACSLVAEALRSVGVNLSESAVEKIWERRQREEREDRELTEQDRN